MQHTNCSQGDNDDNADADEVPNSSMIHCSRPNVPLSIMNSLDTERPWRLRLLMYYRISAFGQVLCRSHVSSVIALCQFLYKVDYSFRCSAIDPVEVLLKERSPTLGQGSLDSFVG